MADLQDPLNKSTMNVCSPNVPEKNATFVYMNTKQDFNDHAFDILVFTGERERMRKIFDINEYSSLGRK